MKSGQADTMGREGSTARTAYLRSPPALSAGLHMENQVSGPLGTDVGSPLDSSQSATEAGQERGPLTVVYKSFTPEREGKHHWRGFMFYIHKQKIASAIRGHKNSKYLNIDTNKYHHSGVSGNIFQTIVHDF